MRDSEVIRFEDIKIGESAKTIRYITEADVINFANISWDHNPLHVNPDIAKQSYFGERIVHGAFMIAQISSLIANKLPGPGSILLELNTKFIAPLRINDTLLLDARVVEKDNRRRKIFLEVTAHNQTGELVALTKASTMLLSDLPKKSKE